MQKLLALMERSMSREIEFRAINVWFGDSQMVFFDLEGVPGYITMVEDSKPNANWKVMQYTGLKDKNGVKIFEGDILQYVDDKGEKGAIKGHVIFSNAAFKVKRYGENKTWQEERFIPSYIKRHIVIGNVYENAELIKEQ